MRIPPIASAAAVAAALALLPLSTAKAQVVPCSPFPLSWPFCIVGAAVTTAATIVTAPISAVTGWPYYGYYGPYGRPYVPPPGYYPVGRYYGYGAPYYYGPR